MEAGDGHGKEKESQELPRVVLFWPPPDWQLFGDECFSSNKFKFLRAWESPLPLDQFLKKHAQSVEAILSSGGAPVTAETLRLMPAVRFVMTTSAGLDHIDIAECRRRGITVANAGNVFSEDVADLAVGLLIDVLRNISASDRFVKQRLRPRQAAKGDCYSLGLGSKVCHSAPLHFLVFCFTLLYIAFHTYTDCN